MRALAVALLLSVPLTAGDQSPLEKAVKLFRSPDAGRRVAGSQLADRELRKLLAPLLKAMEDDDPEVRRRARRSILSLVLDKGEKRETPQTEEQFLVAITALQKQCLALRAQKQAARALRCQKLEQKLEQKTSRLLADFGARRTTWLPGKSGLFVLEVQRGSPAERLGLRWGDAIVRVNGQGVTRSRDFATAIGDKPDWSRIKVTVLRKGRYVRLPKK